MEQRFGVNVATTWGWSLAQCVEAWVRRGVPAIGLGAQIIDTHGRAEGVKLLRDSGLRVSAFTTISPASMDAGTIESTLDLAAEVRADCVYVITGGRKAPPGGTRSTSSRRSSGRRGSWRGNAGCGWPSSRCTRCVKISAS